MFVEQVRAFYTKVLNEEQRKRLCENIAGHLKDAQMFIQRKAVSETVAAEGRPLLAGEESAAAREPVKAAVSFLFYLSQVDLRKRN